MKAYSIDVRERVLRSIRNRRGQTWVARELGISVGTVNRYLKLVQTRWRSLPSNRQDEIRPRSPSQA